ncbi:dCTP deaminase [Escherichia phage phi G17]|uniref:Deoxycytidine triphosphate deaminase n=1 Tax=Escherichia phage phi G17 TaxID=2234086 RepID=A0A2Z4Q0H7_9CAUD|nr:dCTP deaminase [Escherichia phage phi G17]AWY03411.1 deoxycytidine triphosphate deaminase [Escherichia phage phi G17]
MVVNGNSLYRSSQLLDVPDHKVSEHGVSYGLGEAGYDIRIKQDITFYRLFGLIPMVKVVDGKQISHHLGKFALASAIEKFNMSPSCVAIVHDKSTWARRALSVFNTVIEPGWKGYLTLELVYHGRKKLHIPAGSGIAQVLFHLVQEPATYTGKYNNQENKPVAARSSK